MVVAYQIPEEQEFVQENQRVALGSKYKQYIRPSIEEFGRYEHWENWSNSEIQWHCNIEILSKDNRLVQIKDFCPTIHSIYYFLKKTINLDKIKMYNHMQKYWSNFRIIESPAG